MADAVASELPVTLYGTHLGELVRTSEGRALLRWSSDAQERWGLNSTVLSRHLRVGFADVAQTESFFGALLPEGRHLDRLATAARVASNDLVGLLSYVGADLAGALVVGDARAATAPEPLTDDEIGRLLDSADGFLVGGGGSALPGFQRKLTLTRQDGAWWRGNGTLPSTHILKPVDQDHRSAADAEGYVLGVAGRLGLAPFASWVETIAGRPVLIIERYDRSEREGIISRIHQEDAGQALGLPWGGNDKFEQVDSRARLIGVAGELDTRRSVFSADSDTDRRRLLRFTVLNVAVGNTDAHAKNFSLLHDEDGGTSLAPYYDGAPLALDYSNGTGLAMYIDGVRQLPDVTSDHLVAEAASWGLDVEAARGIVEETLEQIIAATRELPAPDSIERHVPGYIRGQATNLREGRPARIPSVVPLQALPRLGTPQPRDA